jgi:phosphate transport system substrate-binding protein
MTKGDNYKEVKSTGEMATNINNTPNAIGYMDLVYVKGNIKAINYNGVAPTVANVIAKKYPVWGYGYMMTKGQPTGATKEFIKYVQSKTFQNGAVKKMKFIPITAIK